MIPFLDGVSAGLGIAIPVGAIAILILDAGMQRGFWIAFCAGAGAASADFFFATLAALAGQLLADVIAPFAVPLRILSAMVLIALGARGLWRARGLSAQNARRKSDARRTFTQTYAQFLALTLLNPATIAYFAALILGKSSGALVSAFDRALFVAGVVLASLGWQTFLAALGALARKKFSPRAQTATAILGNGVIIALGLGIVL